MELTENHIKRLRVLDQIPEFLILIRPDMIVEWVNQKACEVMKTPSEALIGQECHRIFGVSDGSPCEGCPVDRALKTNQEYETVIELGHDRYFYLHAKPVRSETDGTIFGVAVLRRDISERFKMNQALKQSEERFRTLVESAREGIWEVDAFGKTLVLNDRMASMLGYSRDEMHRLTLLDFLEPSEKANIPDSHFAFFNDTSKDFTLLRKDGSPLSAIIVQSPVYNDNGEPMGILYMVTDITERKRLEKDVLKRDRLLKKQNSLLEEKNSALKVFIEQLRTDRERFENHVMENVNLILLPLLNRIRAESLITDDAVIRLLENGIADITSGFAATLMGTFRDLTAREREVCNMVRNGLTSKEIARVLKITMKAVDSHRNSIRKKLNISSKNVNLRTYLSDR